MDVYNFRQSLGMSQAEFAAHIGARQATVSEWETGTKNPSPMAKKLLQLLKERHDEEERQKSRRRS